MKINRLIRRLGDFSVSRDFEVSGIGCNSKTVFDNFVFVAIKGNREDGTRFIKEAVEKGAKAVITESRIALRCKQGESVPFVKVKDARIALAELAAEFYGRPSSKMRVTGITGTNGKTTVTYLIESILKEAGLPCGVIGTVNYRFGGKVISSKNTTPGPVELESMLAGMLKEGIRHCVMEVSSHALDQKRTQAINFSSVIFTNLTHDHLDYHVTLEKYFACKAMLFKDINPDSSVIINNDDKFGIRLKKLTKAIPLSYGIDNNSEILARDIKFDVSGTRFNLVTPKGEIGIASRLIGRHNVYNILAAASWAVSQGLAPAVIKSAMEKFSCVPGRLERVEGIDKFSVFVDYAHTEDALKNVIGSLKKLSGGRVIVVFGCGGERDREKRPKMGRVATELSDYAVITSDNPRSEEPLEIIEEIKKGIRKTNFCVIPQRAKAIRKALVLAKPKDIVLIAGKGHEDYQVQKDKTIHFDDREAVRLCLKSMN